MQKSKRIFAIVTLALALLLISSPFIGFSSSTAPNVNVSGVPASVNQAGDYGDIMQYEWPQYGCDDGQSGFNPGPGPNIPDVLWKVPAFGMGQVQVFNGKAFVIGFNTLSAFDASNGSLAWTTTLIRGASGFGTSYTVKIDDTYLMVFGGGPQVYRISDGTYVADLLLEDYSRHPGSGQYFWGGYSSELKMAYATTYDDGTSEGKVVGISLEDPTQPEIAWEYVVSEASEVLSTGDGKVFVGTTQKAVYALDGREGTLLWRTHKTGVAQQSGLYYNGKLYHAATAQFVSCFDADNGDVVWEFDSRVLGERALYAYKGAAAYGRYYDCAISIDPNGWVVCWDAETGEMLWKQPAYYNIAYNTVAVADGKVYASICDQPAGSVTAGLVMPGYALACFDAFTGAQLWRIDGLNVAHPIVAYGKLYFATGGYLYCIGDSTTTKPWAFGFAGNLEQPRVAIGQSGPKDLSNPKWVYETGDEVSSSPAVVDGKVYIGSHDHNWYCLDAYTGKKIWNFTVGFRVMSSAAVVGGRVFTGADDGYIYCINATTGAQIWKKDAGGLKTNIIFPQEWQPRSSPIVVGNRLYVGALDGKVYCLSTSDGDVLWTYNTGGPIGGSPAYSDDVIYIASTDSYIYALDAADGDFIWKSFPLNLDVGVPSYCDLWCCGTPTVADGVVYVGGGVIYGFALPGVDYSPQSTPSGSFGGGIRFFAFNAMTGASIWNTSLAGNTPPVFTPTCFDGQLYISEFMHVTSMNATDPRSGSVEIVGFGGDRPGNRTWKQWLGYQILSSVAYVDDPSGPKVYVGCDVGSVTCLDATTGEAISAFQSKSNIDSSPSIWDGKLYIGSSDGNVYCFDDSPALSTGIWGESNKGAEMWSNETITICGQLVGNPNEMVWEDGAYIPVASELHPGLPDAEIKASLTKPDGSDVALTTTTDQHGFFNFSYSPTQFGKWGWVVYYDGEQKPRIIYESAYSEWNIVTVTSPPSSETPPPPPKEGIPMEYIYAIVAVIAIIIIAVAAYAYLKRGKK